MQMGEAALFRNESRTLFSLEKIDDYGAYQMTYFGDYGFEEFLENGASSDADIEKFVTKRLLRGLPIDLGVTGGGCTAFVTRNEKSERSIRYVKANTNVCQSSYHTRW